MRQGRINSELLYERNGDAPRHVALTAASPTYQMTLEDRVLIVTSSADDAAGIVTLPPVAEAVGLSFFVAAPTGATGGDVSLYEKETGAEYTTYGDLDADDDHVMLFSDGRKWRLLMDGVA